MYDCLVFTPDTLLPDTLLPDTLLPDHISVKESNYPYSLVSYARFCSEIWVLR